MIGEIDHRADQFSLASLSYRLLTGHEPFSGVDPVAILHQVITVTQQRPSHWAPGLGGGVDAVIYRGMSKRPDARYPHVMAFADALRAAIELIASDRRLVPRPPWQPVPDQIAPPAGFAERDTLTFFRRKKKATIGWVSRAVLFALAAAVAFLWFSSAARTTVRSTWHRAISQAGR